MHAHKENIGAISLFIFVSPILTSRDASIGLKGERPPGRLLHGAVDSLQGVRFDPCHGVQ
jgi:hypothetical protein